MDAGDFFKAAQNRIVIKCAALYDDFFSKLAGVGQLDNLKKGVFDNGIRKPCGNIGDRSAFLLGLLDLGIHKYRAARAKVNRVFGKQRFFCKILDGVIQRFCKGLNKRAAPGRTGFVQLHAVHRLVFDFDAFHVLAADI